jgi:hypothetical protein
MNLQNLINPELWLTVENNAVTLKEDNNTDNETLRAVTIRDLPKNVFVFSTDKPIEISTNKWKKRRNQFLNNENDKINKNCDAVIIHYDKNYLHIACCVYMNRAIRIPKATRSEAQPVKEAMKNYSENIIKYKCSRTMFNNVKWKDLIND